MTDQEPDARSERGADGEPIQVEGLVELRGIARGSRSERRAAFVVTGDGRAYALFLVGENPLEQPTLTGLAGRRIAVAGIWRNGVVRVERSGLEIRE
jgi:hypothetical protein